MWAGAMVAGFIWCGSTPDENPDTRKMEESAHPKANFTQKLMLRCLNKNPKDRPAAAMVSLSLQNFGALSPDRPSGDLFQVYFFTFIFIFSFILFLVPFVFIL
jgi:hypothetical protein